VQYFVFAIGRDDVTIIVDGRSGRFDALLARSICEGGIQ